MSDTSDLASTITAIAALIAAIGTIINARKITAVKAEVTTGNSQTLAKLADATESRRIDEIPQADRTPLEISHLRDVK